MIIDTIIDTILGFLGFSISEAVVDTMKAKKRKLWRSIIGFILTLIILIVVAGVLMYLFLFLSLWLKSR
ncbi:MAG: hypothetical protein A3B10_03830 [Candidatus Doudnabacteria bacterium RIFCSPLOWO2_01_FULL_44_21]|uniref:Uncharacterized protein n=1 Tax=Candidatus Doudnabacteria bacterium RIFCSPLOWO2_01_FULL_44_21 TaxID=1817841 RepID=A0A1F5PY77_9BACT|nr:MAG: hypothetical protein A3B95_02015 [Candidatus Doudnabacteria bacterium RIFCSPHIGHO2_02_FULL_43_13b]OGE94888.1 MAG: hypothetical protein A3B10_03830 [Candidatus Doudnabacteria bacterium RIFCSPLOWO2_01_FULL_44_21]